MTDLTPDRTEPTISRPQEGLDSILAWLDAPSSHDAGDDLLSLQAHLATLRGSQTPPQQRAMILKRLYCRSITLLNTLRPTLADVSLPIPRDIRAMARRLQQLLRALAEDLLATPNIMDGHLIRGLRELQATLLQSSVYALSQHLLISNLLASPAEVGVWPLLHRTCATARRLKIGNIVPEGSSRTLQDLYHSALLLGCAQPASLTARELEFVASYLEQFADQIELAQEKPTDSSAAFWIDPRADAPAFSCARKAAPSDSTIDHFSCDRLAGLLKKQLEALETGHTPQELKLPEFAGTPAGRGVLRRLIAYWSDPGKRRFPRRHQDDRAVLCVGLDSLWRLFQSGEEANIETSGWMITNESPDGYAVMHVSGKPGHMKVGDITAIRIEAEPGWKICIIRWALSESPVHVELGLQILATNAIPAFLAQINAVDAPDRLSVLVLPEVPAVRSSEMMVVPSGALINQEQSHILVVEKENISVREVRSTQLNEQNGQIEVFSITPDTFTDVESR